MAWTVDLDGTDITGLCQSINWHPRWSRPATCVVKYPAHLFSCAEGSELHLYNSGSLVFSGPVWHVQAEGQPNRTDAELTAYDHMIYLSKRLCKQGPDDFQPGNLITPDYVIKTRITAPEIMAAFVQNAIDEPLVNPLAVGSAPLPLAVGSVEGGGPDVTGVPTNFPMSIDQMRQLMLGTGQLAMNLTPGVGSSTIDFVRPPITMPGSSASFGYQTGAYNSQSATVTDDMDEMVNALWYFLGPRGPHPGTASNPRGIPVNHWGGSITPSAPNGGPDGDGPLPGPPWPAALVAKFMGGRAQYGYMQEIRIFDENADTDDIRDLYEEMWANEAWIRATPRRIVGIKPERNVPITFNVGNAITVAAGSRLHGGASGGQIVFEFEVDINVNGVATVTDIVASADQVGSPALGGG